MKSIPRALLVSVWAFTSMVWIGGSLLPSLASEADMRAYAIDGLRRIRPGDTPIPGETIHIHAARNEYEPFQVVVYAGSAGLKSVNVRLSKLAGKNANIQSPNIALYREHYLEVKKASLKSKEGPGPYPDALIPFVNPFDRQPIPTARFVGAPFDVRPNSNQPIWVEIYVPKQTLPGDYTGEVIVTAADQSPLKLGVTLTVWNFTLPDTPSMRSNFGGFGERVSRAHHLPPGSAQRQELERRYAEGMAAHRICPPVPRYLLPNVEPDGSIDSSKTHSALKEWIEHLHVTGIPINLQGNDPFGKDRARNVKYLQTMYSYLKAYGWEKMAYIYVLDEPNDAKAYEEVRQRAALIHQAQPGIKVLCTEQPTPQEAAWGSLVGSVDIWVPLWTLFEPRAAADRLAAGEELWSYTALCQGAKGKDTPYWELDFPLLDYRIPAWTSFRYGITGLLYWTTVYWEKAGDPWTNSLTYASGSAPFNGEGSLFYPGADAGFDGPVASMRLKQIREGLEDYEYLALLVKDHQKPFAEEAAKRLAQSWTTWKEDPEALYRVRGELARKIEEQKE